MAFMFNLCVCTGHGTHAEYNWFSPPIVWALGMEADIFTY